MQQTQPVGEAQRCVCLQSADLLVKFLSLAEQEVPEQHDIATPPAVVVAVKDEAEPPSPAPAPAVAEVRDGVDPGLHAAATSFKKEPAK